MAATAPDWSYVTDEATRDWLHSLPIDEQNELHGRTPDRLQHDFGDRMAATMTFAQYRFARVSLGSQDTADGEYRLGTVICDKRWTPAQFQTAIRQFGNDDVGGFWTWLALDAGTVEAAARKSRRPRFCM